MAGLLGPVRRLWVEEMHYGSRWEDVNPIPARAARVESQFGS